MYSAMICFNSIDGFLFFAVSWCPSPTAFIVSLL